MATARKRYAAITVDMDTLMADMSLGDIDEIKDARIRQMSYSDILPRILGLLSELNIKATFFIIGKDGLDQSSRKMIYEISRCGHEIANHSLLHDRGLCNFSESEFIRDVSEAEKILSDIIGKRILGFRMPGSTIDKRNLTVLEQMGYLYDSSLNSSLIYNLSKACYGIISKNGLKVPCQDFRSLYAPNEPYFPSKDNIYRSSNNNLRILEFPLTLIPWLLLPFMNYFLLTMGRFVSERCCEMVKSSARFINFVMHDNEVAIWDRYMEFGLPYRLCGWHMKKNINEREKFIKQVIENIKKDYNIVTLEEYCRLGVENGLKNL